MGFVPKRGYNSDYLGLFDTYGYLNLFCSMDWRHGLLIAGEGTGWLAIRERAMVQDWTADLGSIAAQCAMLTGMSADKRKTSPKVVTQLILGMALFGTATPLSKIIGENFSIFTASFLRMAIASAVLAPFVWFMTERIAKAERSDLFVISGIATFGMVGFTAAMLFGMRLTTGVIGSTIMSATPVVTAIGAVIFLGASINWRKGGALVLAVAGIAAINLTHGTADDGPAEALFLGTALVITAICFEAAYTLLSRKLSEGISSIEATLAASLIAAPIFIILALVFDPEPFDLAVPDKAAWAALAFWGAVAGGVAPVIWYNGVRQAPAMLSAGAMSVMPITALVTSYFLLGEAFQPSHLIGFGMVFLGMVLMIFENVKNQG
ncbi:DMT family transporter [Altererythrobacter sp. BO-6]|uniref:DMT family transporter n=1 Tax=Altererythrobacter sp. BO-6 TaxID=2604537 RepID=UPI0013E1028B|nr:DMT family transporter [Altererythrobacter sp. BO-6]QIG52962.1 DMT family transporter [Altererythrobacter sp. BO-6]